ncbi:MAG: D-2-hydroxyacid dehydrogenase [Clostridia bacterium]|nr:D-2-hydroxyacid dehydrogenase [Clostridia bacterium]
MKIVILDGYTLNPGDLDWSGFEALGSLTVYDRTDPGEIVSRIGDAEAVIVNKCPITEETMKACPEMRYIGVLATGYNVVDVAAASRLGIAVTNIPTYGTTAVAQMVFAHLLAICHHVEAHSEAVHAGEWNSNPDWCFWNSPLIELAGKTMGIIGFGRIGQNTARIAAALGMRVLAYDQHENEFGKQFGEYVTLERLLAESDVISMHCPLFPETEGMINRQTIAQMKDGVIFINTSRGQLVNEQDLADALNSGKIYAAGLDVVYTEPIQVNNPLLKARNCQITPHIAWAPKESRRRLMDIAVDNLRQFAAGTPVNTVNKR